MKKINKILLILSIVCIVIGLGIAGCGMVNVIQQSTILDKQIVSQDVGETFQSIVISVPYADINIQTSDDSVAKLSYPSSMQKYLSKSVSSGLLTISCAMDWFSSFRLNWFWHKNVVTLTLPRKWDGNISIDGRSGDVSILSIHAGNILNIQTYSGSIAVSDCVVSSLNLQNASGNISIDSSTMQNNLSVYGGSGGVHIYNTDCRTGEIETRSGVAALSNFTASETLSVTTHSGDIHLTNVDSPSISLHSDSGSITGTLDSEKIFEVSTKSGNVAVPASRGNETCKITTKSGNVILDIGNR